MHHLDNFRSSGIVGQLSHELIYGQGSGGFTNILAVGGGGGGGGLGIERIELPGIYSDKSLDILGCNFDLVYVLH